MPVYDLPAIDSKNGGFTLATPKQEESDAEPLQHFFPERSYVPLLEILSTVNRYTLLCGGLFAGDAR